MYMGNTSAPLFVTYTNYLRPDPWLIYFKIFETVICVIIVSQKFVLLFKYRIYWLEYCINLHFLYLKYLEYVGLYIK